MFSLTIWFGPTNAVATLLYKTEEVAVKAEAALTEVFGTPEAILSINDEFGQTFTIREEQINARMTEDLDQSMLGRIQIALHQARTQAKAQQQAAGDPVLKAASMARGPSMIDPFANGGGIRQG